LTQFFWARDNNGIIRREMMRELAARKPNIKEIL